MLMKKKMMITNFVLYMLLLNYSLSYACIKIALGDEWFFGNGAFSGAIFYGILGIFAFRFMKDWQYIKPKSFVILGGATFLPNLLMRVFFLILSIAQGNPLSESLTVFSPGVIEFVVQIVIFVIDIICAIQTYKEDKALKKHA